MVKCIKYLIFTEPLGVKQNGFDTTAQCKPKQSTWDTIKVNCLNKSLLDDSCRCTCHLIHPSLSPQSFHPTLAVHSHHTPNHNKASHTLIKRTAYRGGCKVFCHLVLFGIKPEGPNTAQLSASQDPSCFTASQHYSQRLMDHSQS